MLDEANAAPSRTGPRPWLRHGIGLLCCIVAIAYLPSLGGGFLNWDDPWLLEANPLLERPTWRALAPIWTDLSLSSRYALGAEYLPVRDTSHLIEAWIFGVRAPPMRCVNLGIYLATLVVLWRAMLVQLGCPKTALLAVAAFGLHPVHVESVAWLAGRKDVLAMLFTALAMRSYVARGRSAPWATALWFALAMLSKSMSVALPLLLPLWDLWAKRRMDAKSIALSLVAVLTILPVHLYVGGLVRMAQPYAGGRITTALATMGPVWLRYVAVALWPPSCSIVQEVPTLTRWTAMAALGYLGILGALGFAFWRLRRGRPEAFVVVGFFFVPLLPVSQVVVPLQNRMADRYLWWSVLALALVLVTLVQRAPKIGLGFSLLVLVFWTAITAERAAAFGDSVLVFADAVGKTERSGIASYQLAMALESDGRIQEARASYEEVWRRTGGEGESARRATNNLARLEARTGDLVEAERILRRGLERFPADPKMRDNLSKVLALQMAP